MIFLRPDFIRSALPQILALTFFGMLTRASGQQLRLDSVGARFGVDPDGAARDFYQVEAFASWALPWGWDIGSHWRLESRAEVAAGCLGQSGLDALIASAGPSLVFCRPSFPLSFEGGVSPTVLTRIDFKSKDVGIPFQFTSHAGLNLEVLSRFRLTYRFQHMSNAGLSSHNPGLNLHMFGVSYLF